jgi:hypothetical protein
MDRDSDNELYKNKRGRYEQFHRNKIARSLYLNFQSIPNNH